MAFCFSRNLQFVLWKGVVEKMTKSRMFSIGAMALSAAAYIFGELTHNEELNELKEDIKTELREEMEETEEETSEE